MKNEMLSEKQMISIIILFVFGSNVVIGVNIYAKQDSWIVLILAALFSLPLIILYSRIIKLCPGRDIFEMSTELCGKVFGNIINVLIIWYALHLGAMIIRNFSNFIETTSMESTPEIVIMILLLLLTVYLVKSGIEPMGGFAVLILALIIIIVASTLLFSLDVYDKAHFVPIDHDLLFLAEKATITTAFPFLETILFLAMASSFSKNTSPYKIYLLGFLFSAIFLFVIIIRNISILGPHNMNDAFYPSYTAARVLHLGEFIQRIESSITYNFFLAGTIKIGVCLFAVSKGVSKMFSIEKYKHIVFPCGLLMLGVSSFSFSSALEMSLFPVVYRFYTIPFQIIIPVVLWICAEIKNRNAKKYACEKVS